MEKVRFNSALEQKDYRLLKMDAARKGVNIRSLIADVLKDYIETLRKEGLTLGENNTEQLELTLEENQDSAILNN